MASAIHNNRRNSTTRLSPNQILLGHKVTLAPPTTPITNNITAEERVEQLRQKRAQALDAINCAAKGGQVIPLQYNIGEQVWLEATHLKMKHQKTKLAPKRYGPFKIVKEISPVAYQLELPAAWGIHPTFPCFTPIALLLGLRAVRLTGTAVHGPVRYRYGPTVHRPSKRVA
jgi:hypothetical protein